MMDFDADALQDLLQVARRNNQALGVTGMLLFTESTFLQVLEGAPAVVRSLYEKIAKDQRHANVLILAEDSIEQRNFGDWSMGFVSDQEEIRDLPGFVDFFGGGSARTFLDLQGDKRRIQQLLSGFQRGRWRRSAEQPA